MLSEKHYELLTAYVDGELGARQRKLVERLIRKSPEARQLLRQLETDSRHLRALQTPTIPVDLSGSVMAALERPQVLPLRRPAPRPRRVLPWWTGAAAVASVLGLVTLLSFLYFEWTNQRKANSNLAVIEKSHTKDAGTGQTGKDKDPEEVDVGKQPDPRIEHDPFAFVGPVKDSDEGTAVADPRQPDPVEMDPPGMAIGSPSRNEGSVKAVDAAIPALLKLRDLALEPHQADLKTYLRQYNTLYIEILGRDSARSFDRLTYGFQAGGIELVKDAQVLARRKQAHLPTTYAFYAEDITVEELTKLLQNVADEDGRAEKRLKTEAQFNLPHANLIVSRQTNDHRRSLQGLMGVELKPVPQPIKGTGPLGVDIHKDVVEGTGDQVTKKMNKPPTRQALALVYQPALARSGSVEIKQFMDHRQPPRENTLQVIIVVRPLPR